MKQPLSLVAPALSLVFAACSTPPAGPEPRSTNTEAPGHTATARSTSPATAAPTPPPLNTPPPPTVTGPPTCAGLTTQFDATLKGSPNACTADSDCTCYPDLRMDGKLGVADKATSATLTALSNEYRKLQCPTMFMSTAGPPTCAARCDAGHCK